MSSDHSLTKLSEWLVRELNHELNDKDHARLKAWLAEDEAARQYYVEFMALNAHLRKQRVTCAAGAPLNIDLGEDTPSDMAPLPTWLEKTGLDQTETHEPRTEHVNEIRRIADERLQAFLEEQEQTRRQQALIRQDQSASVLMETLTDAVKRTCAAAHWLLRNAVRLTALTAMILLGLAVTQYALRHRIVATLNEGIHAQWDTPPADANLHPGPMFLKEGFARLTFKQGAEVILQAPCVFDLVSRNKMTLHHGMVTAQVPPEAHGFAVHTPQSTVTDFGTEFGVQVQASTASEVHVFDGRVQVKTASHAHQPSQNKDVTQGKAAVITQSGKLDINPLGDRPNLFVRDIPETDAFGIPNRRLDLADVVGGGSGFGTGLRYAGVDPATGQTVSTYRSEPRTGGTGLVKVPALPFVDCVFVPLAEGGLMPVTTAGHHFDFPSARGDWYVEIAHGGRPDPRSFLTLDGQIYGTVDHPALLMHANVGMTFDLDAMRASLTGSRIKRFTSMCGISNHVQRNKTPDAVFYVLVDGQVRFFRKIQLPTDLAMTVRVDLREDERFLTLVCMEGTANNGDWTLFGVPALELEGVE
ncbi:MAG: FecR domain-containing protein [Phycisphaerae bacterium]|nr:FecR domain-containing protein [Phycisphaerae bacterium]